MLLQGNKILITGATAGIGEALLKRFLKHHNQVIAVGRNKPKLQELSRRNRNVIPFCCDISDPEDLEKLVLFLKEEHQDLNILINNAGIQYLSDFTTDTQLVARIEQEISVNLVAPLKLIAQLLPLLNKNKNSAIVNVSSGLGLVPKMQAPVYCGTKAGLHIFSKSLRYQLKETKVFEIIPALVDTEMTRGRGKNKLTPDQLVDEFMIAFKKDKYEINIGKVKLLKLINRISPLLADNIMAKMGR